MEGDRPINSLMSLNRKSQLERRPFKKRLSKDRARRRRQLTGQISKGRTDKRMAEWKRAVLERDDHICQRCGGVATVAHHVAMRNRRPDLRLEISNGVALCDPCHTHVHRHPKESAEQGWLSTESYEAARKEAA